MMRILKFTLSPQAVVRVYDAVLCLAKFSEIVSLEASAEKLILCTLNSSKSAYASFSYDKSAFFEEFDFNASLTEDSQPGKAGSVVDARFTCQIYNKALLSVFKGRLGDSRDRNTAIEQCECQIQDEEGDVGCRLIVKLVCKHGVIKTYRLSYEPVEVKHASFDGKSVRNFWTLSAVALRSFVEYFGARTEQLDISTESGRTTFTSYTEKLMSGKDVLKQPLQTSITLDNLDFEDFKVEENLHIGINVKDFKAIVAHAESLKTSIKSAYSYPTRPMELSYQECGMRSRFILTTIGDYRGSSATPAPSGGHRSAVDTASDSRRHQASEPTSFAQNSFGAMLPPAEPASRSFTREPQNQRIQRPSPPPPRPSLNPESLFLPADEDEDRQWGERTYGEDEDTLGWSASAVRTASARDPQEANVGEERLAPYPPWPDEVKDKLPPTQRLSQIENLFGE